MEQEKMLSSSISTNSELLSTGWHWHRRQKNQFLKSSSIYYLKIETESSGSRVLAQHEPSSDFERSGASPVHAPTGKANLKQRL
eukprot:2644321-Rhodomonas_salina.1